MLFTSVLNYTDTLHGNFENNNNNAIEKSYMS